MSVGTLADMAHNLLRNIPASKDKLRRLKKSQLVIPSCNALQKNNQRGLT